ncbi:MAG TPA: ABC transporter ATP-binding protein [Methylomirabilota bacterium]|jgi:branched-chain amino acid transport system ATP-binding protein|nr:ABC transporter ATP-binding protein [Methylomirabilota bacterium]
MSGTALLEVEQLEVVYHRVATAIQGVTLRLEARQIVALLGPNGAGKTTTLRAISGFLDADDARISGGRLRFLGETVNGWSPARLARRGLVLVPERDKIFESLTVRENLRACQRPPRPGQPPVGLERVIDYFPILADRRHQLAGYLSGGERQMLAVATALLCQPVVLLVDELSLGLAPLVIQQLMAILRRLRDELGLAILLVEQNAGAALDIADRGYVIENGRIVYDGSVGELLASSDIQEFYLGRAGARAGKSYRDVKQYRRRRRWFG